MHKLFNDKHSAYKPILYKVNSKLFNDKQLITVLIIHKLFDDKHLANKSILQNKFQIV